MEAPQLRLEVNGFYRAEFLYARDVEVAKGHVLPPFGLLVDRVEDTQFLAHTVRLEPTVSLGRLARLAARIDGLQDAVWGQNGSAAPNPVWPANPSTHSMWGPGADSMGLTWLYLDVDVVLGHVRVGRMPANWGLGLVLNHGGDLRRTRGGIDDDFGDNYFPTVYDRLMFYTNVVRTVRKLWGQDTQSRHALYLGYAYDRLVTEPLADGIQFAQQRPAFDLHFLSRDDNDLEEHAAFLLYRWQDPFRKVPWLARWGSSILRAGIYGAYRFQRRLSGLVHLDAGRVVLDCDRSDSAVCGADVDLLLLAPTFHVGIGRLLQARGELFVLLGEAEGPAVGVGTHRVASHGWTVRLETNLLRWLSIRIEGGQASGDPTPATGTYRLASLHPDRNVGLVLYDLVLRQRAASLAAGLGPAAAAPLAGALRGGVTGSGFVFPTIRFRPLDFVVLRAGLLAAWASAQDGLLYPKGRSKHLGTELDLGVDFVWGSDAEASRHLFLRVEGGYLLFGGQLSPDYDSPGSFAFRTRLAFVL